jgi:hypothetical protein
MAWAPLGEGDDYSGDAPMDAFGAAVRAIAGLWSSRTGRLPSTAELARCLREAFAQAPEGSVLERDTLDAHLKRWLEAQSAGKARKKRVKPRAGDLLRIPYAADGARAAYARVLFVPEKEGPQGPGLGICVVVLDRDVCPGDAPEQVLDAPWLLGPFHPNDSLIREGVWEVLGNVPLRGRERELPYFAMQTWDSGTGQFGPTLQDYFGHPVEDTPENRARVVKAAVGGSTSVVPAIRALRGLGRWLDGYETLRPHLEPPR